MSKLSDIGEYGLHKWVREILPKADKDIVGIGDDTSVLDIGTNDYLLLTSDRVPLGVAGSYAGRLSVIHNFSDIIAKGGSPYGLLLDVYLPSDTDLTEFQEIILAAKDEVKKYRGWILGGDTKESPYTTIVGMAVGFVKKDRILLRTGAKVGDIIAITKTKGKKYGWRWAYIISKYFNIDLPPDLHNDFEIGYHDFLSLPYNEMSQATLHGGISSCIDMSDGLGASLEIIARMNDVGACIYYDSLMSCLDSKIIQFSQLLEQDPVKFLFSPGYEWENLCTITPHKYHAMRRTVQQVGGDIVKIGEVAAGKNINLILSNGKRENLNIFGDEKFKAHAWQKQPEMWKQFTLY